MSHTDEDDRTILVSNISSSITAVHLRELFSAVGKILELHHLPSLGQCWIEYARVEGAKAAVFLAGTPLGDKEVQVAIKSQLQQQAVATAGDSTSGEGDEKKESTPTNEEASSLTSPTNGLSLTIPPNTQPSAMPLITPTSVTSLPPAATPFESLVRSNPALAAFIQSQQSPSASTPPSSASSFVIPSASTGVDQPFTTRTIYVGNLGPDASDILLRSFFGAIGPVVATKFSGDASLTSRYAFVEFEKQEHATAALAWDQRLLVDRMVKIGKAHNSITKSTTAPFQLPTAITPTNANTPTNSILMSMIPSLATSSTASSALPKPNVDPSKISAAMEKVRAAQEAIARKLAGLPPLPTPADTPTNAATVAALNEKSDATASTTSTSTSPALEEERKEGPPLPSSSSSSRPSRSRSRPRSRTRSRSRSPPRPDYAERQRLKREAEERSRAARYAMTMPGTIPEFDRWGARDRETQRTRDRSPSSRHHRSRHSRSRSRSRSRDRRSRRSRSRSRDRHTHSHSHHRHRDHNRRRQGQGPANGGVPMVWDGYQWHPAVPLAPMITPTNTTTL